MFRSLGVLLILCAGLGSSAAAQILSPRAPVPAYVRLGQQLVPEPGSVTARAALFAPRPVMQATRNVGLRRLCEEHRTRVVLVSAAVFGIAGLILSIAVDGEPVIFGPPIETSTAVRVGITAGAAAVGAGVGALVCWVKTQD